MGQSASTEDDEQLTQEQVDSLKSRTHFSGSELRDLYDRFIDQFPSGRINKDEFIHMYREMLPDGESTDFAVHVFNAYDKDQNGTIDFKEFMLTLSTTTRGTPEERLRWAFSLYDVNKDGILARKEIVTIISSIYKMQGMEAPLIPEKAEDTALKIFVQLDKDRDDCIDQHEFVRGITHCDGASELLQGMAGHRDSATE